MPSAMPIGVPAGLIFTQKLLTPLREDGDAAQVIVTVRTGECLERLKAQQNQRPVIGPLLEEADIRLVSLSGRFWPTTAFRRRVLPLGVLSGRSRAQDLLSLKFTGVLDY